MVEEDELALKWEVYRERNVEDKEKNTLKKTNMHVEKTDVCA